MSTLPVAQAVRWIINRSNNLPAYRITLRRKITSSNLQVCCSIGSASNSSTVKGTLHSCANPFPKFSESTVDFMRIVNKFWGRTALMCQTLTKYFKVDFSRIIIISRDLSYSMTRSMPPVAVYKQLFYLLKLFTVVAECFSAFSQIVLNQLVNKSKTLQLRFSSWQVKTRNMQRRKVLLNSAGCHSKHVGCGSCDNNKTI